MLWSQATFVAILLRYTLAGMDESCSAVGQGGQECLLAEERKTRVAIVTHSMGIGGVERQILLTASAVDRGRILMEVVLFQENGLWAGKLEAMGIPVRLFRVWESKADLLPGYEEEMARLVQHLEGFDVVHTWYGGGNVGSFGTFGSHAARRYSPAHVLRIPQMS